MPDITGQNKKRKSKFNFTIMMLIFALVPLTISIVVLNVLLINKGSKEVTDEMHHAMTSTITQTGAAFDYNVKINEDILKNYAVSPILTEYLKNPNDATLAKKAQDYTLDFFGNLEGWEGIYLADWNSKVMTHPAPPVIGKVMREGEALDALHNSMLDSENGIFNTGIIESPASGQLIISMYVPIYDNGKPIGYVGGGTFVNEIASGFSDVSELHLDSAYIYFVDGKGTMLYHPDPEKLGKPVENAAVKQVVADLEAGKHPKPECVTYDYKGVKKYASYYVGAHERYIAVVTADEKEVLTNIKSLRNVSLLISAIIFIFFVGFVLVMARVVTTPLKRITKALDDTAKGNLDADTDINSIVYETQVIIESTQTLKTVLNNIIGKTKSISEEVNSGAVNVALLADNGSSGANHIVGAMEELSNAADTMNQNVMDITSQVKSMGDAVDTISEHTEALVVSSNNIKKDNVEADEYMEKVSAASKNSVAAVRDITNQIAETNKAIAEVEAAVNLIIDIASQTDLLSLNASIEAARAGDVGRGFAVVAEEIKNLSEQSNVFANDIKVIVTNIIEQSQRSVSLASKVADIILDEQKYISDTKDKFRRLSGEIQLSLDQIQQISEITEQLNESKEIISNAVMELSAISEENSASNEAVTASIHGVTDSVIQIATNSEATKQLSEDLKNTIAYFN